MIHHAVSQMLRPIQDVFLGRFDTIGDFTNLHILRKFPKAIVMGGGTIRPGISLSKLKLLSKKARLPLYTIGTGLVGYRNNISATHPSIRPLWETLFELCESQLLGVRGPRSQRIMAELGKESTIIGDAALSLFGPIIRSDYRHILVNFGNHDTNFHDSSLFDYYQSILSILQNFGLPIILTPLHHIDITCHNQILKQSPSAIQNNVTVLNYVPSIEQFRGLLHTTAFGVGERLHFGIPLASSGIPIAMLGYLDKHLDFAESISASEIVFPRDRSSLNLMEAHLKSLIENEYSIDKSIQKNIHALREHQRSTILNIAQSLSQQT
jgi:polysaccharide pyruvyl transferase WcaK-like protein